MSDYVGFCRILSDFVGFCRILSDFLSDLSDAMSDFVGNVGDLCGGGPL